MSDLLKKHWTTLLGAVFLFLAIAYLFKYAIDQKWLSNGLKIGIGLLIGSAIYYMGVRIRHIKIVGEIIIGLGSAVIYTTFAIAGIYYDSWSSMTVFLATLLVTLLTIALAYKEDLRLLMNLSVLGGLVSPLIMKPVTDQVFTLFVYLLVINAGFFVLSVLKNYAELRITAFVGTWILYAVYDMYFTPHTWQTPLSYASAAFVFYVIGFFISSWKNDESFDGVNLYLMLANAIVFGTWAVYLLDGVVSYSAPLSLIGGVYLLVALLAYFITRSMSRPILIELASGAFLLLVALQQIGTSMTIKPLISTYFWAIIAALVLFAGQLLKRNVVKAIALGIWLLTVLYWFVICWDTPSGIWFGIFLPFLNWSAIAWIVLAVVGFYASLKVQLLGDDGLNELISYILGIISHLIVGGLLTVQISDIWSEYHLTVSENLTMSIVWGVYALLLFLWGAYSKQTVFRVFGSIVLIGVALKTFFFDLANEVVIYKIVVLVALGIISFGISFINNKWNNNKNVSG